MRVKGFQKENGGIRVELDEGQLLFWSVKNNIVRCIYTKEEVVRQGSPLGIQAGYRFDLQARNRAEALEISNGWLCVAVNKETGAFHWRDHTGRDLLEEGPKELQEIQIPDYAIVAGETESELVHTVDGDRNFVKNLCPVSEHSGENCASVGRNKNVFMALARERREFIITVGTHSICTSIT